jgi:hypothetical protein
MARSSNESDPLHGGTFQVPRSRGALSGVVLLALGIWGALICFVGPYFSFAFTPDRAWQWTSARGWLEVLPGTVTFVGAVLLLISTNRVSATFGAWLSAAGGAWFIVGPQLADLLKLGSPGTPTGKSSGLRAIESLAFFAGLGTLIVFVAASALGRLSIRSVRDLRAAQRRRAKLDDEALAQEQRDTAAHGPVSDRGLPGREADVPSRDGQWADGQRVNGQPVNGQPVNGQPADGQLADVHGGERQWVNGQPVNGQPVNGQPVNGQPADGQRIDVPGGERQRGI